MNAVICHLTPQAAISMIYQCLGLGQEGTTRGKKTAKGGDAGVAVRGWRREVEDLLSLPSEL